MKYTITADEIEQLPDALKEHYTQDGESYVLNLEGHEDHLIPKSKRDIEAEHRKSAEKKLAEVEAREARLLKDLEGARNSKADMEEIRKQHEAEVAKIREQFEAEKAEAKKAQFNAMIKEEASRFANEKFTVPTAITRLYQDRLTVEEVDGQPILRVLEENGRPSIKSLSDLQTEFLQNKEFAPIIRGTNGKGSGANPNPNGNSGGAAQTMARAEFDALNSREQANFIKSGGEPVDD